MFNKAFAKSLVLPKFEDPQFTAWLERGEAKLLTEIFTTEEALYVALASLELSGKALNGMALGSTSPEKILLTTNFVELYRNTHSKIIAALEEVRRGIPLAKQALGEEFIKELHK